MAIADVLWACPLCGEVGAIRKRGRHERCAACNTAYRRGSGAEIIARPLSGDEQRRSAAAWLDSLPPLTAGQPNVGPAPHGHAFRGAVTVRSARPAKPLYVRGELLGWIEDFEHAVPGELVLDAESVAFEPRRRPSAAASTVGWRWQLERLRVLQPSSATLQIRCPDGPLVMVRFLDGSVLLWEVRFKAALRNRYAQLGLGSICEFQPRICTA